MNPRIVVALLSSGSIALADTPPPAAPRAADAGSASSADSGETIEVTGEVPDPRVVPPIEGARIYAGKKITRTDLDQLPPIGVGTGLRQALALTPGLLVSEVTNQAWASLSYRGLGEPHESWNILTLRDGIPIVPDMFSYPAAYATPSLASVERVDFIRGGASLLYGPQPGGVLDYVSRKPVRDRKVLATARAMAGNFGARSIDASVSGTGVGKDRPGYRLDASRSTLEGMRPNADSEIVQGAADLAVTLLPRRRLGVRVDAFALEAGEPGGLTRDQFLADRTLGTTPNDRIRVSRVAGVVRYEHSVSDTTELELTVWGAQMNRTSRRQAGTTFGELAPVANVSVIQVQKFQTLGAVGRVRHDVELGGRTHHVTAGAQLFVSRAPVSVRKGDRPTDWQGRSVELVRSERGSVAGSAFGEAVANLGKLRIVPGMRVDVLRQRVRETLDLGVGDPLMGTIAGDPNGELGARASLEPVVLPGLGLTYALPAGTEAYANVTRGYKPRLFNDGVTFQNGVDVAATFEPTHTTMGEAGVRLVRDWLQVDASAFYVRFSDQVGLLGTDTGGAMRQNIGRMVNHGVDLAAELDVLGLLAVARDTQRSTARLALVGSAQLLEAEIVSGAAQGNRPQHAPPYLVRAGALYRHDGRAKLSLLGTFVGAHSAVDNTNPMFDIPAYAVWDALYEVSVPRIAATVFGGVTNLTDERYYSRIRPGGGGGIDPGLGRMVYVGVGGEL